DTSRGKIYVTNFRASRQGVGSLNAGGGQPGGFDGVFEGTSLNVSRHVIEQGNLIETAQFVPAPDFGAASRQSSGTVRFDVWAERSIAVSDELPVMSIGSAQCDGAYVDGSTHRMSFQCAAEDLPANEGQQITIRGNAGTIWSFGTFSSA